MHACMGTVVYVCKHGAIKLSFPKAASTCCLVATVQGALGAWACNMESKMVCASMDGWVAGVGGKMDGHMCACMHGGRGLGGCRSHDGTFMVCFWTKDISKTIPQTVAKQRREMLEGTAACM